MKGKETIGLSSSVGWLDNDGKTNVRVVLGQQSDFSTRPYEHLLLRIHLRIHAMWQSFPIQACNQILRCHPGHFLACRFACTGNVWSNDHILKCEQWAVDGQWLRVGHIQACAKNAMVLQGFQ